MSKKSPVVILNSFINMVVKSSGRVPYLVALVPYIRFEGLYWVEYGRCGLGLSASVESAGPCLNDYVSRVKENNVKYTLWTAFGRSVAEEVYSRLEEEIHKPFDALTSSKKLDKIMKAIREAEKRVLKLVRKYLLVEIERRITSAFSSERNILDIACLVIALKLLGVEVEQEEVKVKASNNGYILIELSQWGSLSKAVSLLLNRPVHGVEDTLIRYLLGFRADTYIMEDNSVKYLYRIAVPPPLKHIISGLAVETFQNKEIVKTLANNVLKCESIKGCNNIKNLCEDLYIRATLSDPEIEHVDKITKKFFNKVMDLRKKGKNTLTYYELSRQELADIQIRVVDRLADRLIRRGLAQARYVGPAPKDLPKECRGVGYSKDPWLSDRARSGEIKLWLITCTGNKELRRRRRRCWERYIVIDFTKLFNEFDKLCETGLTQLINAIANQDKASQTQ